MSQIKPEPCAFDWVNGTNVGLKGGELLGLTDHRFSYAFFGPDGRFTNGFIAHVNHGEDNISLLTTHSTELGHHLRLMFDRMGQVDGYGLYVNGGEVGGLTVFDHAHLHVLRRDAHQPATGMGLGKLVREFNRLSVESPWGSST